MSKSILIDELHFSVFIPRRLPMSEASSIRRTLRSLRFQGRLRRAIGEVFRQFPSLCRARVAVSR